MDGPIKPQASVPSWEMQFFEPPDPHPQYDADAAVGADVYFSGQNDAGQWVGSFRYAGVGTGQLFVVNGAVCACSVGTHPTTLSVPCLDAAAGSPSDAANVGVTSFSGTFGFCNNGKHPDNTVPCKPVTPGPWEPGAGAAGIGGLPALLAGDLLKCNKGGIISITNPGQGKVTYAPRSESGADEAFIGADGQVIITVGGTAQEEHVIQDWAAFSQEAEAFVNGGPFAGIADAFAHAAAGSAQIRYGSPITGKGGGLDDVWTESLTDG